MKIALILISVHCEVEVLTGFGAHVQFLFYIENSRQCEKVLRLYFRTRRLMGVTPSFYVLRVWRTVLQLDNRFLDGKIFVFTNVKNVSRMGFYIFLLSFMEHRDKMYFTVVI